jgi:hypothetical protein
VDDATRPDAGAALRRVAVPGEHGGWSLTLEPAILGILVAPSGAGLALIGASLTAFLIRTPLKFSIGDRLRRRNLPRTRLADRVATAYGLIMLTLLVSAHATAPRGFWTPILAALPLFAIELAYDARGRSRRLAPELLGTIGIGSMGAAIVLAGSGGYDAALAVWAVAAARAIATVPFVRVQLRRAKQQDHDIHAGDAAQVAAVALAVAAMSVTGLPAAGAAVIAVLALVHIVGARLRVPPVPVIGAQQVVLGLTVVLVVGLAMQAP